MARILVAASPEPCEIVVRILAGHDLTCVDTLARAEQSLHQCSFDLILCTIAFDESKLFELLRFAKSEPSCSQVPFVAARVRSQILRSPGALRAAAMTCGTLGAEAFLDIVDYQVDPEREMRQAIEGLLASPSSGEHG
jgi:CheY-like chemotaxis protein